MSKNNNESLIALAAAGAIGYMLWQRRQQQGDQEHKQEKQPTKEHQGIVREETVTTQAERRATKRRNAERRERQRTKEKRDAIVKEAAKDWGVKPEEVTVIHDTDGNVVDTLPTPILIQPRETGWRPGPRVPKARY